MVCAIRFSFTDGWRVLLLALGGCAFVFNSVSARAAEEDRRGYDLPADEAERSLKLFSQQSGRGVIVGTAAVKEVRTNAVKGTLTAEQALSRMLAGTGLVATRDEKNGAFAVRPEASDPNVQRAARTSRDRPKK